MKYLIVACLVIASVLSCRQKTLTESAALEVTGEKDDVPEIDLSDEIQAFERFKRNKEAPWVNWQWFPGMRQDPSLNMTSQKGGTLYGLATLDRTRAKMMTYNLVDTNGYYGSGGIAGTTGPNAGRPIWIGLRSGDVCDEDPAAPGGQRCEKVRGCGDRVMTNPKWRARSLHGECNDFDNPMMGSVGQRMSRNVSRSAVDAGLAKFSQPAHGGPDVLKVADELMVRQDDKNFNPAPHFNMWAAAWIQFMTHDWFAHSRNGFNDPTKKLTMNDGSAVPATQVDDGQGIRADGPRPTQTFRNNTTHWWDGSQIYGWDKASEKRVRNGALLKMGADGLLPELDIPQYNIKQEAAAFIDNWWLGLSLVHNLFTKNHNWLVVQLKKNEANGPDGKPWTDDTLYDTARLINSALIAKIHTTEWTPQLLFNRLGGLALQGNWHGLINFDADKEFNQVVKEEAGSKLVRKALDKLQTKVRCTVSLSLLGSFSGITRFNRSEHFCSPFAFPEEFTTVYRLHAMLPDYLNIFDGSTGKMLNSTDLQQKFPAAVGNQVQTKDLLRDQSRGALEKIGLDDWQVTFGKHPCGQLTAHNFPKFLSNIKTVAGSPITLNMAAMDLLRDRERGVPRFNEFRRQVGLKPLKSFNDFIDSDLQWEIDNAKTRDFTKIRDLTTDEIDTRKAVLAAQKTYIEKLKTVYDSKLEDVDTQVGVYAEFVRPHGFVISETQFQVFILNASRRIFSDRFLTESYKPEFYTNWGFDYVQKTYLMDIIRQHNPAIAASTQGVRNAFDIWDREKDGFSLCPDGSAWFDANPELKKTYKNLFCHSKK